MGMGFQPKLRATVPSSVNGDRRSVFRQGNELLSLGLLSRPAAVHQRCVSVHLGFPTAGFSAPRVGASDSKWESGPMLVPFLQLWFW